jgi:hypothetical protein
MPPGSGPRRPLRALRSVAAFVLLAAVVSGCGSSAFDPSSPCSADAKAPGDYPALEALVPRQFDDRPPDRVDSGRNCTPTALGSLVAHSVAELRFAGATWDLGSGGGVTLAILEADPLDAAWVAEFYQAGARTARNTESVDRTTMTLPDGRYATRIDTLNGESYQTVVVWPDGARVRVALIASAIREVQTKDAHEAVVTAALAAAFPAAAFAMPPSHRNPC